MNIGIRLYIKAPLSKACFEAVNEGHINHHIVAGKPESFCSHQGCQFLQRTYFFGSLCRDDGVLHYGAS